MVQPIASTTISTDDKGLVAGEVSVRTMTGPIPAYRALPDKSGKFPLVLVVQEIFGVHEHIKDVCRRLAKLGYFAIAMDVYHRQGDVTQMTDNQQIFAEVVNHVPDSQVMSDLDASVVYAEATGHADTARLGITGFCWGGRITWTYCVHNPKVKAGVAWYGRLVAPQKAPLQPAYPIEFVPHLKVPVLGLYGSADASIPVEHVEQMRAALKAAGKTPSDIISTPITVRATARRRPRTAGNGCRSGSGSTASHDPAPHAPRGAVTDPRGCRARLGQSGLSPTCFATLPQTPISLFTNAENSAGVLPTGMAPCAASFSFTSGRCRMRTISRLSFCNTSAGTLAGANTPYHS
jgi:carboxymethylenebutenolidase